MKGRCEARVLIRGLGRGSYGCPFAAKHHHRLESGRTIHLCAPHYHTLLRRIRLGTVDALLERWRAP